MEAQPTAHSAPDDDLFALLPDALIAHALSLLGPRSLGRVACVCARCRDVHCDAAVDGRAARLRLALGAATPRAWALQLAEQPVEAWRGGQASAHVEIETRMMLRVSAIDCCSVISVWAVAHAAAAVMVRREEYAASGQS